MSIEFTQAASRDQFLARLDEINQGLTAGSYLDESLKLYTKYTACFWMREVGSWFRPITGSDSFSAFRAATVAESVLRYSQANKDFLTSDVIDQRLVTIIDLLNRKNVKAAVATQKDAIRALIQPAINPAAPAAASSESAPAAAAAPASTEATAEKVASAATSAAAIVIDQSASLSSAAASTAQVPSAPSASSPAMISLNEGERALAKRHLNVATDQFAFELHCKVAKKERSYCVSPVGVMDSFGVLLQGLRRSEKANLVKRLNFTSVNPEHVAFEMAQKRADLKKQNITVATAFIAIEGIKQADEFVDKVKQFGAHVSLPASRVSARRELNKWMEEQTGIKELFDASYSKGNKHQVACSVVDVITLAPTIALTPSEKIPGRIFTLSDEKAVKVDFYGFANVKVLDQDDFKMLVVPYVAADGQAPLEKVIFLPNKDVALTDFNKKLTADFVKQCQNRLRQEACETTTVYLPITEFSKRSDLLPRVNEIQKVTELAGYNLSSLFQQIDFSEETADVQQGPAAASDKAPLYIDRTFYYFVKNGDDTVLEGRVDDGAALGINA